MRRSLILAFSLAFLAPFAAAQHHGTMSARSMAPRSAAPIVSRHIAAAGPVRMSSPARVGTRVVTTRTRAGGTTVRVIRPANSATRRPAENNRNNEDQGFSQDFSAAPGLGFDETHVVATRGRRSGEHGRNGFDSGFFPFFDGGFIVPTPVGVEQAPPNEVQEQSVEPDTPESAQRVRPPEPAPASSEAASAPRPETEEYVFVRRDGTVFFAVAYSWDNGLLRYITQDGLRRSISGDVLDLGATQQFNDQLGLNFHAPA